MGACGFINDLSLEIVGGISNVLCNMRKCPVTAPNAVDFLYWCFATALQEKPFSRDGQGRY